MNILVISTGLSFLRYELFNMGGEKAVAKGLVGKICISGSKLMHMYGEGQTFELEIPIRDHKDAIRLILEALADKDHGLIGSIDEIAAIAHHVLFGGKFAESVIIDDTVEAALEEDKVLDPLHAPVQLACIRIIRELMPNIKQVAAFDTAFHQTMPAYAYLYGIPMEYAEKYKIRRYGFQGISHRFVSERANELLGREHSKIVVCYLANSSSLSAVVDGKCIDTSMGLTPNEGVLMGTRLGSIDPAIVGFLAEQENTEANVVLKILNRQGGLSAIAGIHSPDMHDIIREVQYGNERSSLRSA